MVVPSSSFTSFNLCNNAVADFESNAPVGSSANRIEGSLIIALAAAVYGIMKM